MDERQRVLADKLTVAELVTTQVVALPPVVRLRELISTMRRCKHQAFPITPEVDAALLSGEQATNPHQTACHAGSCGEIQ